MTSDSPQVPDTRPGNYYVSVFDGRKYVLLAGPFVNDHAGALAMVGPARDFACNADGRGHFLSFGTVRRESDFTKPGRLNDWLVLPPVWSDGELR